jgi:acetyl-CoA/propionyl-CoA carboxylase, biotin carboxylase, biotin carboxyl carrier protein
VTVIGPPFAGGGVVSANGSAPAAAAPRKPRGRSGPARPGGGGADTLPSPMQGNMWRVKVRQGDTVEEGQLLCIIEAMKMENEITAHKAGVVAELPIAEGAAIAAGDPIATITSPAG